MSREDDKAAERLAKKVLSKPELFPDEFPAWVARVVATNVSFKLDATQLPTVEPWHVIGASGQPAFQNGWTNFGGGDTTAAYYKDPLGVVHLKGTIKSGTMVLAAFTLPAGYRPQEHHIYAVWSNSAFAGLVVQTGGGVVPNNGSNASFTLDGVTFRAYA